jgi:Ca-activated chloride channel homolog
MDSARRGSEARRRTTTRESYDAGAADSTNHRESSATGHRLIDAPGESEVSAMHQGRRIVGRGLLALGLLAMTAPVPAGPPVFQSRVDLVNLHVTVTDPLNRFVRELPQEDFEVLEDGVPQRLALFTEESLPISISILIDTSNSMQDKLADAQAAAISFTKTLRPQDQAQIIQFNERVRTVTDFTPDGGKLEAAIRSTRVGGATALYNAIYVALKDLSALSDGHELRRLAVVVLSDGDDTASLVTDDQVLELARRTGVGVYGISLRAPQLDSLARTGNPGLPTFFFSSLTRDTGGEVHFLKGLSQLKGVYDRFAEELRSQYSIGYVSNNPQHDGKWRRIAVRILNHGGVQVRHKLGYYAPK